MAFFSKKKDEQIEVGQRKEDFREKQVTVRVLKLSEQ